jgi:hypothetical protein
MSLSTGAVLNGVRTADTRLMGCRAMMTGCSPGGLVCNPPSAGLVGNSPVTDERDQCAVPGDRNCGVYGGASCQSNI